MFFKSLMLGMGLGAGLMYVLDPEWGERRRRMVARRSRQAWRQTRLTWDHGRDAVDAGLKYAGLRRRGPLGALWARLTGHPTQPWPVRASATLARAVR